MINIYRTKKIWLLLLRFIHAGRSMLCIEAKTQKRGIAHRIDMAHRV
jgi:hypothetical protein